MSFRLSNLSIRLRLNLLLVLSTLGVVAILGLALYVLMTFRIGSPMYQAILAEKELQGLSQPAILYVGQAYIQLQMLETSTNPAEIAYLKKLYETHVRAYEQARQDRVKPMPDSKIKRMLDEDCHIPARKLFEVAESEFLPNIGKGPKEQAEAITILRAKITPLLREHRTAILEVGALLEGDIKDREKEAATLTGFWTTTMLVLSLVSVVLGGLFGWLTHRSIIRSNRLLLKQVNELASGEGDLTKRIPVESSDELGQLAEGINAMIAKIQTVVAKVRQSSLQLLSTASEISATARQQDTTVQGLSSSTTQVAAAVREISATSKELAGTMSEVNDRANQAAKLAASGKKRLGGMESTMEGLVESTASISGKLATIRDKANTINMVVTTITKVADQTNLLSINAAIEAEKAGEYGRGFLVVAREIRRLADQTAVATLDIDSMVRHMQEAVTSGVMQMDKFSEEVRAGMRRVAEINGQTGQIIEEVHGLSERYHQVNEGMRNQAIGAEQINEAMGNMTTNIRQTAAALEEFNRATAHMRGSVEMMNQEFARFKI
jgi:methyl-accepting chemotaxis protein WspA